MTAGARHERYLELAAAGLDFALTPAESLALDGHLAGCPACAHAVAGLRVDAAALRRPAELLPSRRVDVAVVAAIAGRPPRSSASRSLVLVAATAVMLITLLGAAAVGAMLQRAQPPQMVAPTLPVPAWVVAPSPEPSLQPTVPPGPSWLPVQASLPVDAGEPRIAVGPDGGLYVLIDTPSDGAFLALLDSTGWPRRGWPMRIPGAACEAATSTVRGWLPVVASDGSVRLVCRLLEPADGEAGTFLAYAFRPDGTLLPGWPVQLPRGEIRAQARVVEDRLLVIGRDGDNLSLVAVEPGGSTTVGAPVHPDGFGGEMLGTDGAGYAVRAGGDGSSSIIAFDLGGVRPGWPITVDGPNPGMAAGPDGGIVVAVVDGGTTRTEVHDRDGRPLGSGSPALPFVAVGERSDDPAAGPAPLVAADGTTYLFGEDDAGGAVVYAVDGDGSVLPGWPFRDGSGLQWQQACPAGATGCGGWRGLSAVGADGTLYVPLEFADPDHGGRLAGIGRDGRMIEAWPVELARQGAEFWSTVVKPDATVHVVAIEPEAGRTTSATILGVAPDSTVRTITTVVEP